MGDVARIQNTEQQRDETQRRQFALALQQEADRKKTQVQSSHRSESPKIESEHERKIGDKEKRKKRKHYKQEHKESQEKARENNPDDEQHHIDLKA